MLEKRGIPTVIIDFEDQCNMVAQTALRAGLPHVRYVHASRLLPGPDDVNTWIDDVLDALTAPLTKEEKESRTWVPTSDDRIIFEGTMDEADAFFNQEEYVPHPVNAPIVRFTDGLPVRIPTEKHVAEMLKGTSHKPDEIVAPTSRTGIHGKPL